jgi:tRNA pseudouridine55 synthase
LILDKPPGITSRAALDRAAAWFPLDTRVGHAGTLDPLASGVLVLCLGKATRLVEFVQDLPKTYRARLLLGARSDTDDADGVCVPAPDARVPDLSEIRKALHGFVGEIQQVPPKYSAARHQGKRAYKLARKQHEFELAPRLVKIQQIAIETYAYPQLDLVIDCGKGTYIRSLARDLGECLGCGGLIAALRRTRIGEFNEANALKLESDIAQAREQLLPISTAVAHLPRLDLSEALVSRLCQGQRLAQTDIPDVQHSGSCDLAVFDGAGQLAVIVRFEQELARISPVKVMR